MIIQWHRRARQDLRQARAYIARENPQAAARVAQRILNAVERLPDNPEIGRPGRVLDTRELVVTGTSNARRADHELALKLISNGTIDVKSLHTHSFGLSKVIEARFGVHLAQLLGRRAMPMTPQQELEAARAALRQQKEAAAGAEWERNIRARAYVELREPPR